jgi:tetratricopeptide (TPR) repeat protein
VAVIAARGGAYEEALEQQERALAAYRDLGHEEGVADSSLNFAAWCLYCGDYAECERILDEFGSLERHIPLTQMKFVQMRALLAMRRGESDGEKSLVEARRRAGLLKASYFVARMNRELANDAATQGRLDDAVAYLDAAFVDIGRGTNRTHEAETFALSARVRAALGDEPLAREHAARAMSLSESVPMQTLSEIAWNAAAAHALLGDAETAMKLAETSAAAAVREAMGMPARLAETFLALPWHQHAFAYLWGRAVPLRWH